MEKNIVAISVEKIQKYIFQRIDQSQTDEKTLKYVILASNNISKDILNIIKNEFCLDISQNEKQEDNIILWISGKVIFSSNINIGELQNKLEELYKKIYIHYQGNIFLNYAVFPQSNLNKMDIIRKANLELKDSRNKSEIIKNNCEILFQFQEINKIKPIVDERNSQKNNFEVFLYNMDDLVVFDSKHESDSTDGKIAIVKADINNLGNIMSNIESYEDFLELSKLLESKISIDNLAQYISEFNILKEKIVPFYIAGDDIFYAVRIDSLLDSIHMLHDIVKDINNNIEFPNNEAKLSIAIGVVFVNNHQPIRYYKYMVENELSKAKKMMKNEKSFNSLVGISLAGNLFNIYNRNLGHLENDGFIRFCREVEELRKMHKKNIFSKTALHNLLINLETEKNIEKKMLYALYFLKPNLSFGETENEDLYFKYYWLSQLVDTKKYEEKFFVPEKIEKNLIPKLKIVLVFLKEQYEDSDKIYNFEDNISDNLNYLKKGMRSVMFHKPINYILSTLNYSSIEKLFIKINKKDKKSLYITAKFEPSIFFRAKKLIEIGKKDQVATMFKNYNSSFNTKNEEQEQSVHNMDFDEKKFDKMFSNVRDVDWLDRLILLYQYNEQRIILKTSEKNKKLNSKKSKMKKI